MKNHCYARKSRPIFQILIVSLIIIFFVNQGLAQKAAKLKQGQGHSNNFKSGRGRSSASSAKSADYPMLKYGPHKRNFMHLWLPESDKPTPLIIHIHGGGFRQGDITDKTTSRIAAEYNRHGVAYADVEYRLLDEAQLPQILRDCARAVQFLRYYADKYNLDKKRVASFGGSAGAGTSFWLATHDDLTDPDAEDPVLRQSSRICAAGGSGVQATYDIYQWPEILGVPADKFPRLKLARERFQKSSEEELLKIRKDLDMLGNLDASDPPLHFSPGTPGIGVHSAAFPKTIKEKADAVGVECVISDKTDSLKLFMLKHLRVAAEQTGQKYNTSWDSLLEHEVPRWLIDAKFGIYAHWGVYSVPAYGNEWYARRMYDKSDRLGVYQFHQKKYGSQSRFGYKDLIPLFSAENFNPDEWADLIAKSGARFAGIAVVHHDGFLLWDSDVSRWCAGKMGPKRDLYGELVAALRRKPDMKIIATFHHIRTFDWYLPPNPNAIEEGRRAGWDLFDPRYADLYWNRYTGKFDNFITQWKAKVKEVVDKYQPDVLWFDGGKFQEEASQHHVLEVLAYYLNKNRQPDKQVDVLNKLPVTMQFNFPRDFGVLTFEEGRDRPAVVDRPWIDDMKISTASWGYIEGQTYKSANEIIDGLVDRVSRGGGLLLSLCPQADGTINQPQKEVLLTMGRWLKQNGEAVYGTRPWKIHAEGPTDKIHIQRSKHSKWVFNNCDAGDIRFTCKGNTLYAIALSRPENNKLTIKTLRTGTRISTGGIRDIFLLESNQKITWSRDADGLTLEIPNKPSNDIALAFKINVKGVLDK